MLATVFKQQQGVAYLASTLPCSWRRCTTEGSASPDWCGSSGSRRDDGSSSSSSTGGRTGHDTQRVQGHTALRWYPHTPWGGGCEPLHSSSSSNRGSCCSRIQRTVGSVSAQTAAGTTLHQQAQHLVVQGAQWQQPWRQLCQPHILTPWATPARSPAGTAVYSQQPPLRHLHTQEQEKQQQQQQQQQVLPGSSWTSAPNLLSLSRVAAAPLLVWLVLSEAWAPAVALVAAAAVSDWADGHLARHLGHTSVLGSYLDPLGDKVFIGALVGALGWQGSVPAWLVALVLGRDVAMLGGITVYRLRMFQGRWPGWRVLLDVDGVQPHESQQLPTAGAVAGQEQPGQGLAAGSLPRMQPLFISKLNTALVFVLLGGAVTQQWQGWPGAEVLQLLEWTVAGTTAASGVMYGVLHSRGQLLPARDKTQV